MNTLNENSTTVHSGLDIAKATLQLHLQNRQHVFANDAAGHRRLLQALRGVPGAHVVCEATGGYERAVVAALHAAEVPVSVLNPAQVRHFALGRAGPKDPNSFGPLLREAARRRQTGQSGFDRSHAKAPLADESRPQTRLKNPCLTTPLLPVERRGRPAIPQLVASTPVWLYCG